MSVEARLFGHNPRNLSEARLQLRADAGLVLAEVRGYLAAGANDHRTAVELIKNLRDLLERAIR